MTVTVSMPQLGETVGYKVRFTDQIGHIERALYGRTLTVTDRLWLE